MSEADPIEDVISDDDSEMVTVWAPEPSNDADALLSSSIDQWIDDVKFETTEDVPIPTALSTKSSVKKRVLSSFEKQQNSADTC